MPTEPTVRLIQQTSRIPGPAWVPLAGAAVAAALLGTSVDGSQAVAMPSTPAPVPGATAVAAQAGSDGDLTGAGTLLLTLREDGSGFGQAVRGLAPGDRAARYVELVETGTLDGRDLRLAVTATGPLARALRVEVDACRGGGWAPATGTCGGPITSLLASTPLKALADGLLLDPLGPARRLSLRVTLTLADRQEESVDGILPAGSLQGAQAELSWRFSVVQA